MLKNLKIGTRLQLMTWLILGSMFTVGCVAIIGMRFIDHDVVQLVQTDWPKTTVLDEIRNQLHLMTVDVNTVLLTGEPAIQQEAISRITELQGSVNVLLEELAKLVKSSEGQELLGKIMEKRAAYTEQQRVAIELAQTGHREQATASILRKLQPAQADYVTALINMSLYYDYEVAHLGSRVTYLFAVVQRVFLGLLLGAAILLGITIRSITRGITRPIAACVAAAKKIAAGDTTVMLDSTAQDETGDLERAMARMVETIKALISDTGTLTHAAAEGNISTRADPARHQGDFRRIVVGINETLDALNGPLNVAAEYVDRISKGDIPPRITDTYHGDFKEIKNNINACVDIMNNLLGEFLRVIQATAAGNLDERAKVELFSGDWKKLVTGVNEIIASVVIPLKLTTRQLHEEVAERRKAQESLLSQNQLFEALNMELEQRVVDEVRKNRDKDRTLTQSEKMASVGQLAAGVAHEINNPLGFITSNLRTLDRFFTQMVRFDQIRQQSVDELSLPTQQTIGKSREALDIDYIRTEGVDLINESLVGAERVRKIVLDLMNFSRVDNPEQEAVALDSCLESALNICYNDLKYVATIRKEYESLPEVLCHPGQLNQVFLNLLVNAGQAIVAPGEIVLRSRHDDAFVYVSVSDTGKGIPEEIRDRIFDPFFTTKAVGQGTGLGLSISYEIIKKHRGELLVESVVGRGTTFTVKLPRTPVKEVVQLINGQNSSGTPHGNNSGAHLMMEHAVIDPGAEKGTTQN